MKHYADQYARFTFILKQRSMKYYPRYVAFAVGDLSSLLPKEKRQFGDACPVIEFGMVHHVRDEYIQPTYNIVHACGTKKEWYNGEMDDLIYALWHSYVEEGDYENSMNIDIHSQVNKQIDFVLSHSTNLFTAHAGGPFNNNQSSYLSERRRYDIRQRVNHFMNKSPQICVRNLMFDDDIIS